MTSKPEIILVKCTRCGGQERNHQVVYDHQEHESSPDGDIQVWTHYKIVKCMGCNAIRFRESYFCTEDIDPETGNPEECGVRIYQEEGDSKYQATIHEQIPEDIKKIYIETIKCFNAGANTLSGGGLRATVEAICKDQRASGDSLKKQIDALVQKGVLAKAQADLLHEERYIGNDALHEMKTPADQDIIDGLAIVEGLMKTIYVLPIHAARIRTKRKQASSSTQGQSPHQTEHQKKGTS